MHNCKNTPGPWHIENTDLNQQYNIEANGSEVASTVTSWTNDEENLANAKLIAAAPDMLDILVECQKYHLELNSEIRSKIKAVIKKATE